MADCPKNNIWDLVEPESKLCAQAGATTAKDSSVATEDFDAVVKILQPDGTEVVWKKADLEPGPKCMALGQGGAYAVLGKIFSGPSGPTVTLRIWIDDSDDCTWTNDEAGTWSTSTIAINVGQA